MAPRVLTSVPITFAGVDGSVQHAPLVAGSIGGVEARFVLDTGSDVHILTKELVDDLGLPCTPGEDGVDHSGTTMPSWAVADVTLALGRLAVTLDELVSIPAPEPFHDRGIGGIVSPQRLHPAAVCVIDLARDELILVEGDDATVVAWLEQRTPELTTLSLVRDESFGSVVVPGAVRPFAELPTLLNTGGKRTEFSRGAVPGLAHGSAERLGGGVSGAAVIGAGAGAQVLLVGGQEMRVAGLAVRETMHDPQGIVGMDVLRGTVLACAADRARPVFWQIPA